MSTVKPPLSLLNHFYSRLEVNPNHEYDHGQSDVSEPVDRSLVGWTVFVATPEDQDPEFVDKLMVIMQLTTQDTDKLLCPYHVNLEVIGVFQVEESVEPEKREELVVKNGGSILYSGTREFLAMITSRMSGGPFFLPTVTFANMAKRSPGEASQPVYRKKEGSDTWHWQPSCSNWPTSGYTSSLQKPDSGEFCNECAAKS